MKGIHLEGLRVLGSPGEFAQQYYDSGADELIFMDVVASLYDRNSLHDIIRETAKNIFIPLTVGGGVRTIADVRDMLRAGADKVAINTAAVKRPELVAEASREFGASTIVGTIEAIRQSDGKYRAFVDNGREETGLEVIGWATQLEELGVGEILLTAVDREGGGEGFDADLIEAVARAVTVPVIAHGGAGSAQDVVEVAMKGDVSACAVASVLHYGVVERSYGSGAARHSQHGEGNREFIGRQGSFSKISTTSVSKLKHALIHNGIPCAPIGGDH